MQTIIPGIGSSSFTIDVGSIATNPADITWNDFNFDGYPDLLLTGDDMYRNNTNQIFLNDGTGQLAINKPQSTTSRPVQFNMD
ncbi:MAG: hypothetical protein IPN68_09750 [Bacteroidetes bacterium]|nr:hypothetical protein [Bacteroidota bacterium]